MEMCPCFLFTQSTIRLPILNGINLALLPRGYTYPMEQNVSPNLGTASIAANLGALSAALPCFYLSFVLINVWREPMAWDDGNWIRYGIGLLLLEFLIVHSGVFFAAMIHGTKELRTQLMLGAALILFYGLMVGGFAYSLDSMQLLWLFAAVCVGRVVTVIVDPSWGSQMIMGRSALSAILYLFVVMLTAFIPIPEWGISMAIVDSVMPDRGQGLWEVEPQRPIVGAALYFFFLGLAELTVMRTPNRQSISEKQKGAVGDSAASQGTDSTTNSGLPS